MSRIFFPFLRRSPWIHGFIWLLNSASCKWFPAAARAGWAKCGSRNSWPTSWAGCHFSHFSGSPWSGILDLSRHVTRHSSWLASTLAAHGSSIKRSENYMSDLWTAVKCIQMWHSWRFLATLRISMDLLGNLPHVAWCPSHRRLPSQHLRKMINGRVTGRHLAFGLALALLLGAGSDGVSGWSRKRLGTSWNIGDVFDWKYPLVI